MDANRKSNRLKDRDYSLSGFYFVTICVLNKIKIFGRIENGESVLNKQGSIIDILIKKIPLRYLFIEIDQYVIMPDHIHIILQIKEYPIKIYKSTISNIIGSFKSVASTRIKQTGITNFKWQRSFHDRIIRDMKELYFTREYIELNPKRWEDKNYMKPV